MVIQIFIAFLKTRLRLGFKQMLKLIKHVVDSGRQKEIKSIKIWRNLHSLEFPSFYLELSVMNALKGYSFINLANNVLTVFKYLASEFLDARIQDPANTANVLSNDLTYTEKKKIADLASITLTKPTWNEIIQ